ncbi:MAG TPA: succinate dehydrogenase cytochrome b subunit [Blastocatellia bacterium]|nr:succinate dehydrogenase cytochrome b subunit [Blastocatellia bacterium]
MNILTRAFSSSLGKKYFMAVSGLILFLFVIAHMLGNLQVYLGPEVMNNYAHFLKSKPSLLWTVRVGLLVAALVHIVTALQLAAENRASRPERYAIAKPFAASFASRTILVSGVVLFAFIIYHLMHFTLGVTDPQFLELRDPVSGYHDVYRMTVIGFSDPVISGFYIISMGLLALHLSHGVGSLFQSLGLRTKRNLNGIIKFARLSALIIFIGNCSIPISVLVGAVKLQ